MCHEGKESRPEISFLLLNLGYEGIFEQRGERGRQGHLSRDIKTHVHYKMQLTVYGYITAAMTIAKGVNYRQPNCTQGSILRLLQKGSNRSSWVILTVKHI